MVFLNANRSAANPLQETPVQNVTPTQGAIRRRRGRIKKRKKDCFFHTM